MYPLNSLLCTVVLAAVSGAALASPWHYAFATKHQLIKGPGRCGDLHYNDGDMVALLNPAQFSDNPFGFAEVCNKKLRVKSSDNTSKIITVTVKDQYLGFRDADDIVLMQAAFNAIVNQHEETELSVAWMLLDE
ncbi:hypothetical protein C8Q76DRAFT_293515 [Earliella scabrosa]|nr:hypothetical protein C8Q76DRAFT_293515 [Earliella scabrosa]